MTNADEVNEVRVDAPRLVSACGLRPLDPHPEFKLKRAERAACAAIEGNCMRAELICHAAT